MILYRLQLHCHKVGLLKSIQILGGKGSKMKERKGEKNAKKERLSLVTPQRVCRSLSFSLSRVNIKKKGSEISS